MPTTSLIRVLSVSTSDVSGGAARAAYRIYQGVRSIGIDCHMFVKDKDSNDPNVYELSAFIPKNPIYKASYWLMQKFKNKWQQYKWFPYKQTKHNVYMSDLRSVSIHGALQKLDFDVLHLHWVNQRFLPLKEMRKIHKPIVWTLHDSWPFCGVCHYFVDCDKYKTHCGECPLLGSTQVHDLAYEVFDKKQYIYKDLDLHIVTPSRWLGECARQSTLLGRFPIQVIPNCIDTNFYKPIEKEHVAKQLRFSPDKTYILFGAMHATADPNKGFDILTRALRLLSGLDVELIIFGTKDNVDSFDLPFPIHSLGNIYNDECIVFLYNLASVTIVPSRSENLSNTIMESMSCGTPVVAFNIGGNGDMIDHKQNGYLAKENDYQDLAQGIRWCLAHNTDDVLGKNAREKVLANYTIDKVAGLYKDLYQSLI